jgi:hypothetical protein
MYTSLIIIEFNRGGEKAKSRPNCNPHTRIDFTHNSVVTSSSSPCLLSFEAREEVKEANFKNKKNPWT